MKPRVRRTVEDIVTLSERLLQRGLHVRINAGGQSMFPYLRPGDLLEVEPAKLLELKPGDIVVFRRGKNLIAHRLHRLEGSGETLTGVSIGDSGVWQDEPLKPEMVPGRVVARIRNGEHKSLRTPQALRYGRLMVRLYPLPQLAAQFRLRVSRVFRRAGNLMRLLRGN